ncbi:hypothetical protein DEA8626_02900 [Defluviimonas aquaemixtae]|uniref:siroheme decarboxylase n=1 Tax=Albidovulum aquaemixtae TaxID=1542388 RepID=A0A2R8BKF5_9RHOB|nr:AsnC family transcriptional regulator [Defluviimonas aquaemixtae]SPH23828.1 hypothetical protein DEA8626_02900 [Defluviimonas aquaemixtae]
MLDSLDPTDRRLLDDFQRDLPLVPRPFAAIGECIGIDEDEVISRLGALRSAGMISRVGATLRPNTAGASTLAAMTVSEGRVEEVAAIIGEEPGVNHSYLREDPWNLWFVATAPDPSRLEASLSRIGARSGLRVLDLRLVRPFNIDLGFRMGGARPEVMPAPRPARPEILWDDDRPLLQAMSTGLTLLPRPFAILGRDLGREESTVIKRIGMLQAAGILSRIGVIVRHRPLGWTANAMIVWDLPAGRIDAAGPALARHAGVTLCYERRTVPGIWDYPLYSMIHARSRPEALAILSEAARLPELSGARHRVLFSTRCFRQTGALIEEKAA